MLSINNNIKILLEFLLKPLNKINYLTVMSNLDKPSSDWHRMGEIRCYLMCNPDGTRQDFHKTDQENAPQA